MDDINAIRVSRESLHFKEKEWVKTSANFDMTMGSKDGAECCEIVDLYLIHQITEVENILQKSDFGTLRDDYLGIAGANRASNERIKKKLIKVFEKFGLKIVIEMNKTKVNFLDVTMKLTDGPYKPFIKPNCNVRYVRSQSDHWNTILKQIPPRNRKEIEQHFQQRTNFVSMKDTYQNALNKAGCNCVLKWNEKIVRENPQRNRRRKKATTWYNPPYSQIIKTNVGKEYIRLVRKWFMSNPSLKSEFNTTTMKVSYSACSNMKDQ